MESGALFPVVFVLGWSVCEKNPVVIHMVPYLTTDVSVSVLLLLLLFWKGCGWHNRTMAGGSVGTGGYVQG